MVETRRKQRVWEQQREQVLAAAAAVFGRRGASGATMAEVARHAGVAVGTLYKFFPSKQALHLALLEERAAAVLACAPTALAAGPDGAIDAGLEAVPDASADAAQSPPSGLQKRTGAGELLAQEAWASWLDKEPERRERRAQAQRAELLAAASTLFQERGFAGAGMADIAAAAGVATGTLYNFFPSKEALFYSLIEDLAETFFAHVRAEVDPLPSAIAKIERFVQAQCAFFEDQRAFLRLYLSARSGFDWAARQDLGAAFQQKYAVYVQWVAGILAAGMDEGSLCRMDPQEMAWALLGMLNAWLIEWTVDGGASSLAPRAGRMTQLFFMGAHQRQE